MSKASNCIPNTFNVSIQLNKLKIMKSRPYWHSCFAWAVPQWVSYMPMTYKSCFIVSNTAKPSSLHFIITNKRKQPRKNKHILVGGI